jgi:hypothetical protein
MDDVAAPTGAPGADAAGSGQVSMPRPSGVGVRGRPGGGPTGPSVRRGRRYAARARTSLPGRAPVCSPRSNTGTPETKVAT